MISLKAERRKSSGELIPFVDSDSFPYDRVKWTSSPLL
jgi:hypothetical protein